MLYDYDFTGRKPSISQVMKQVREGLRQNCRIIQISWGENRIDLERSDNGSNWYGYGWIKGISGYDIAEGLNNIKERVL